MALREGVLKVRSFTAGVHDQSSFPLFSQRFAGEFETVACMDDVVEWAEGQCQINF